MYLKSLELHGFKSFAQRTRLEFEPGMTSIVGPNGCGKSNVADAIRWVLGEQSPKAMRGSKMEDVIFNGTDDQKAVSMAEVSLTLADCESTLNTDFNEVTVTRRVFRSGEGQYLINKTPCRLKDIHRLFMDTGIGTNSYSLMEQGRIDLILSSRPDDRRTVFEEASGITKFKADKKEALRKLEHTEANLLRLDDIIREVKRQIISLQRQAGKARRFKVMQDKLRAYDLFGSRRRMTVLEQDIKELEAKLASISERDEALREDLRSSEEQVNHTRSELAASEEEIGQAVEASIAARNKLDRTREQIKVNRDRIDELIHLSERDTRDADDARKRLEQHASGLRHIDEKLGAADANREGAEQELGEWTGKLQLAEHEAEGVGNHLNDLRTELVDLESETTRLQNELAELEIRERGAVIKRERLAAEEGELRHTVNLYQERESQMAERLAHLRSEASVQEEKSRALNEQQKERTRKESEMRQALSDLKADLAAKRAHLEILTEKESERGGFAAGARLLTDPEQGLEINRNVILGTLSDLIEVDEAFRKILEAVLRDQLDAVALSDNAFSIQILEQLEMARTGSARLVSVQSANPPPMSDYRGPGERLLDHVRCEEHVRPLVQRLLHNVFVVDHLNEIPQPLPWDVTYATRSGTVARGTCEVEFDLSRTVDESPYAQRRSRASLESEVESISHQVRGHEEALKSLGEQGQSFEHAVQEATSTLDGAKRNLALAEGENQLLSQEAQEARDRVETVSFELHTITDQQDSGGNRRSELLGRVEEMRNTQAGHRATIASKTEELRQLEQERTRLLSEVTERRVNAAERRQEVEHFASQRESLQVHVDELQAVIHERSEGVNTYQSRIEQIEENVRQDEAQVEPLQGEVNTFGEKLQEARSRREEKTRSLAQLEEHVRGKRATLDDLLGDKGELDVQLAQQRMRHQNMIERVTSEWHITPEQIHESEEPEWDEDGKLDGEALETGIAELRAKLESMGPVNLVAIEEHQEHEERYAFLTNQQDDLVKSKQQLLDMIRKINKTTTEMFSQTFNQVNDNFQVVFKKLFGGGSAKLVLVDEEDVLESGIEIIARPPGKKLQTVSLLSGGERTMTAVALLFSLYMVKPSPFCCLDELDAALDDANIGRFVAMLKEFVQKSQFIVITHNRQTIGAADCLYGVTMEKRGISKIVSVKFSEYETKIDG